MACRRSRAAVPDRHGPGYCVQHNAVGVSPGEPVLPEFDVYFGYRGARPGVAGFMGSGIVPSESQSGQHGDVAGNPPETWAR